MPRIRATKGSRGQAGFTLVESLVAILAVTTLISISTTNNTAANHATAATAQATEAMERLKAVSYDRLIPGGSLTADLPTPCGTPPTCFPAPAANLANYNMTTNGPGVGLIRTRWLVTQAATAATVRQITVRSESVAPLMGARSRAEFTTYRTCTTAGCPF
jgi:prepilin-type N-terminal cleavage/methylation domain-containing protein